PWAQWRRRQPAPRALRFPLSSASLLLWLLGAAQIGGFGSLGRAALRDELTSLDEHPSLRFAREFEGHLHEAALRHEPAPMPVLQTLDTAEADGRRDDRLAAIGELDLVPVTDLDLLLVEVLDAH